MDPLSISASVAGLLTLAEGVFGTIFRYVKSAKNAEKEITQLRDAVQALCGVLARLKLIITELEDIEGRKPARSQLIEDCSQTLTKLNAKLNKVDSNKPGSSKIDILKRKIQWPFAMNETKELLVELERHKSSLTAALSVDTLDKVLEITASHVEAKKQLQSIQDELQRIKLDKDREEILNICGAFDPLPNHQYGVENRQSGTGLWLIQGTAFQDWLVSRNHTLWISGIPGAGKTVLAALSIQETLSHVRATTALGFYYCDYKKAESQDPVNVLNSLAAQLAWQSEQCYELLREACLSNAFNGKPSKIHNLQLLHNLVVKMASKFEEVSIITDGLDECGDRMNEMAQVLADLSLESTSTIKVLLFSRNEQQIRDVLLAESPQLSFDHIEIAATSEDLGLYVAAELAKRIKNRQLRISSLSLQGVIQQKLVEKAAGMFRWVTCQLDHLCQLRTDRQRREALDKLPPDLKGSYERILERVASNKQDRELFKRAIIWIIYAKDPLSIRELCQALSIDETSKHLEREAEPTVEDVLASCSSFIRRAHNGGHLESAHFTVQEFFEAIVPSDSLSYFRLDKRTAELELSKTCLRYLQLEEFHRPWQEEARRVWSETSKGRSLLDDVRRFAVERHFNLPFLEHAAHYWMSYSSDQENDDEVLALLQQLFDPSHSNAFSSWSWEYLVDCDVDVLRQEHGDSMISVKGVDFTWLVSAVASAGPLHLACLSRSIKLTTFLLARGCNPNKESEIGSPLALALRDPGLVGVLASLGDEKFYSSTAFWAFEEGSTLGTVQTAMINLLLRSGADLTILEKGCHVLPLPLIWRALWSRQCTELMMKAGAPISRSLIGLLRKTCLLSGDQRVRIASLLSATSEITVDEDDKPILSELIVLAGLTEVVDGTHQHQSAVIRTSQIESTKRLQYLENAARHGMKRLFLDFLGTHNLDLGIVDKYTGRSALHIAATYGAVDIVRELLSRGADPDIQDKEGCSPIHCCITAGNDQTMQIFDLLRESGATLQQADNHGITIWHLAALHDEVQVLEKLEEIFPGNNVRLNLLKNQGRTPLENSFFGSSINAAEFQLQASEVAASFAADPVPLLALIPAKTDNANVVPFLQFLLKQGLAPEICLSDGSSLLHLYVDNFQSTMGVKLGLEDGDWDKVFEDLAKQGADLTVPRNDGKLPLHLLCNFKGRSVAFDQMLHWGYLSGRILRILGTEATADTQDSSGATALHLLCSSNIGRHQSATYDYWYASFEYLLNLQSRSMGRNPHGLSYVRILAEATRKLGHSVPVLDMLCKCIPFLSALDLASSALAELSLLSLAVEHNHSQLLEALLDTGFDVDRRQPQWPLYSALELACSRYAEPEILQALLGKSRHLHRNYPQGLMELVCYNGKDDETCLRALLRAGIHPDQRAPDGSTALIFAAISDHTRQVDLLVASGADVNAEDKYGLSAAFYAAREDNIDVLIQLEDAGIDMLATYPLNTYSSHYLWGATVLHVAAFEGSPRVVKYLISSEGLVAPPYCNQLQRAAGEGYTPFLLAAEAGQFTLLELMVSKGAAIDARTSRGLSALHLAVKKSHLETVRVLLNLGCDADSRDNNGNTPILYALQNENMKIFDLLKVYAEQPG